MILVSEREVVFIREGVFQAIKRKFVSDIKK